LDCFGGSGTTALVARKLGRRAILIELNESYCALSADRLKQQAFDFTFATEGMG
jgi:site-specific DNA-methyltransferase (adenine-specific)